jgi:hypothetical protein
VNGGGAVAQYGAVPTGEHGGHPPRLFAETLVPHRIDTLVQAVKTPASNALGDRSRRQSSIDQLPRRHDPMLHTREACDMQIG